MSDTPRTDAFEDLGFLYQQMTCIDFARQLERELADANAEVWRLRDEIARLRDELCITQEASK